MATTIQRLDDAFASTLVAVYEPLIVRWVSGRAVEQFVRATTASLRGKAQTRRAPLVRPDDGPRSDGPLDVGGPGPVILGLPERDAPELAVVDELSGRLAVDLRATIKETVDKFGTLPADELRRQILESVQDVIVDQDLTLHEPLTPVAGELLEYLSPIGVAHFFRQIYFSTGEGVGPIEQAFSVAPKETLELVVETVRSQVHEEIYELGLETVSELASESRDISEVSDKVASMLQRDSSTAIGVGLAANAQGGTAFFSASGSVNFTLATNLASSSAQSREIASRKLKEVTKRASERITRSYSSRIRDSVETTVTNTTRRTISNPTGSPINYGLRRVFNKLDIRIQALGPRLVWQTYVRSPGEQLARSRFASFAESQPLADPNHPPAVRPRPTGDTDRGSTISAVTQESTVPYRSKVEFSITAPPGRTITRVSIDNMTDVEKPDAERKVTPTGPAMFSALNNTVVVPVRKGESTAVRVDYTYAWEPSKNVVDEWEAERKAASATMANQAIDAKTKFLRDEYERHRQLLVAKSRIRARPAEDLRREEQYEVMNALVSTVLDGPAPVTPLEIESFHRYFEVESLFYYAHPSWWTPRYRRQSRAGQPSYEITPDSEPAPMGSSLNWAIQLDGDVRRNEFLNSPWVRACIPIHPGREREALGWLAARVEGTLGYDTGADPLRSLLVEIETFRRREAAAGPDGPEYATFGPTAIPVGPGTPPVPVVPPGADVYPIVTTFEVATPTEGFLYDEIALDVR